MSRELSDTPAGADDTGAIYRRRVPPGVEVHEMNGRFIFGAAEKFKDTLGEVSGKPRALVIRMRNVPAIDSSDARAPGPDPPYAPRRDAGAGVAREFEAAGGAAAVRAPAGDGEEHVFGGVAGVLRAAETYVAASGVLRA